mmetsp:Transcript_22939/g.46306  ORF Transcript_22939/g.46306 Transcript_22939/m.46306 type:complete len:232 (-) Transcript_22939:903-1598(-)
MDTLILSAEGAEIETETSWLSSVEVASVAFLPPPPCFDFACFAAFLSSSVLPSNSFFFSASFSRQAGTSAPVTGMGTPMEPSVEMVSSVSVIFAAAGATGAGGPPPPFFLLLLFFANANPNSSSSAPPAFLPTSPLVPGGRAPLVSASAGAAGAAAASFSLGRNALSTFSRSMHCMISSAQGCPMKGKRSSAGTSSSMGAAASAFFASHSARRWSPRILPWARLKLESARW